MHLAAYEKGVSHGFEDAHANLIVNVIANVSAAYPASAFPQEFVPVMPALERAFLLQVGKMMVPFEFSDAGDPSGSEG